MNSPISQHRLTPFFHPRSIAIVGASDRGLYPAGILQNLLEHGYPGALYPVNPRRETLFGLPCYASLAQLPAIPDLVVIIVPRQGVLGVVEECLQLGVPAALIFTAGFGESDDEGKALEAALARLAAGGPTAIVGPNCAGLANLPGRMVATRLAGPLQVGTVSFVSASGALMMALHGLFADANVGLSHLLSLGNGVDVGMAESLAYLVADSQTAVIGAFIEGIDDGPGLVAAAEAALASRKPIVLVKSGRTTAGQSAAATHTAALAGSDRVFQAVCRQFGLVQVDDIAELVQTVQMFSTWAGRWPQGKRVAVVTQSGGMGSLTADLCALAGLDLPPLSATVRAQLQGMAQTLAFDHFGNPTDVRGAGVMGAVTAQTLAPFLADPESDVVVLLLAKSAVREDALPTAEAIVAAARTVTKPLCVVWTGQQRAEGETAWSPAWRTLIDAGIPTFVQPSDCVHTLTRVIEYQQRAANAECGMQSAEYRPPHTPIPYHPVTLSPPHPVTPSRLLSYQETVTLLNQYTITVAAGELVENIDEAIVAARRLGYPVAVKLVAPQYSHKSDAGLVRLNVQNEDALVAAVAAMMRTVAGIEREGILVQAMASGVEALVGLSSDPQFGPVLACGPGGILVELLDEVALRLPPLAPAAALAMLHETKLAHLLAGVRGQPPADMHTLACLLVKLSKLAVDLAGKLVALDMNPVIVLPAEQGIALVDVRVLWKDEP